MSINNYIAQGFNVGEGAVRAQQIKNQRAENNYIRQQQSAQKAQQWAMQGIEMAKELPPEAREGWLNHWRDMGMQQGIETPEIPQEALQTIMQFPGPQAATQRSLVKVKGPDGQPVFLPQDQAAGMEAWRADPVKEAVDKENAIRSLPPTRQQQADTAAAEARAQEAQLKADKKAKEAESASATKGELESLAQEILIDEDAVRAVYGNIGGALPSVFPGTVDAEAKIDRLVDMLTLENTSKMTGVLSESDIKILQRAGTTLANKRISEKMALKELKRIAGVVDKAKVQDLVNKYAN